MVEAGKTEEKKVKIGNTRKKKPKNHQKQNEKKEIDLYFNPSRIIGKLALTFIGFGFVTET